MLRLLKKLRRNERGNVLILAGFAMPLIVGSAGLAVDTVQWALAKRQLQRAADSAALAGVYALVQASSSQTAAQAVDYELNIGTPANLASRNASGYTLTAANRQISYPAGASWTNPVRVELAVDQIPSFSSMFIPSVRIAAGATAATISTGVYCVVSLVNTATTGIRATGNAHINMGCGMITNSTSLDAAIATGSSSVTATPIAAVGAIPASTHWNGAELLPFTVKQNDPYAGKNIPSFDPSTCVDVPNQPSTTVNRTSDSGVVCLNDLWAKGTVNLGPATYVINGGSLRANSGAVLTCTGCTIILTNSDTSTTATFGTVDLNGGARINMTAPTTGTYAGILMYQDRRAPAGETNLINGNSDSTMSGALYFPKQELDITGSSGLDFNCAQFVSWTVNFSGNGTATNTCTTGYGTSAIMGRHVRLVA